MPLSNEAYQVWNQFKDANFPEKFCHFSGEPSKGGTCYDLPILRQNWNQAREVHHF